MSPYASYHYRDGRLLVAQDGPWRLRDQFARLLDWHCWECWRSAWGRRKLELRETATTVTLAPASCPSCGNVDAVFIRVDDDLVCRNCVPHRCVDCGDGVVIRDGQPVHQSCQEGASSSLPKEIRPPSSSWHVVSRRTP